MRAIAILGVLSSILFFLIGGVLTWFGVISVINYAFAAGIIGSIASSIGLLSFASPRLTSSDLLNVEGELVEKLSTSIQSVREYENKISKNKEEIEKIERERREIELLVRQARPC